jgi:class 3 adenylate cyclase/tetratricopeptide (TPR) repeat protein
MTEALMQHGDEGVEILSSILNRIFEPMVNLVYEYGGFISVFAGDAFTAIFPINESVPLATQSLLILNCAEKVQTLFAEKGLQKTVLGEYRLAVKAGVSFGQINWGIVGKSQKAYFFSGEAIDGCAYSEHHAEKGDIIFDEKIKERILKNDAKFEFLTDNYYKLSATSSDFSQKLNLPHISPTAELKEDVASKFLPKELLSFSGTGEFRNVASVFISFDGISEIDELNSWIYVLLENIKTFSGYFNKLDFGDKGGVILCAFGAPIAFEDNVERALDFVLAVQHEVNAYPNLANLKFRVGITYGVTFAGIIGGSRRCEYTILGDIVNLSARFMMKANFGEIWVAERIYRYTQEFYRYKFLGEYRFKGKSDTISVYQLDSKKDMFGKIFRGKFVNRRQEFETTERAFSRLKEDKFAGILYIYGEAGVGKSRFAYELKNKHDDYHWLYLPCDGILQKPFNPFRYFFSIFFNQSNEHTKAQNKKAFESVYEELLTHFHRDKPIKTDIKNELIRLKTVLAGFLGIEYENSLYSQLDPKLQYENTLEAFKEIFKYLSCKKPVVLEVEDFQWIDPDSLHALQTICRGIDDFPILLIITSRYDDEGAKPKLPVDVSSLEMDLNTLSPESIREIAAEIVNGEIADEFLENLVEKTGGNPFFVEQTVLYYKESQIIDFDNERHVWMLKNQESAIPAGIKDLLIARVDRLSEKLKEAVQTAAVLGKEFEITLLLGILKQIGHSWTPEELDSYLKEAESNNIWTVLLDMRGVFANTMTYEAVYKMQLRSRLKMLHNAVAEFIEKLFPRDKQLYADLAYHYQKAENRGKTMEYLEKAGDFAKNSFQNEKALEFYNQLDALMESELNTSDEGEKIREYIDLLLLKKCYLLHLLGRNNEGKQVADKALSLSQKIADNIKIGYSKSEIGNFLISQGNYSEGRREYEDALELLKNLDEPNYIGIIYHNLGRIHWVTGTPKKAMEYFEKNLSLNQTIDNKKGIAMALGSIGILYDFSGETEKALEYYNKQLKIYEELENKVGIAETTGNIGVAYFYSKHYDKALQYTQKKLEMSRELGDKKQIASAACNIGLVYFEKNNYDKAMSYFHEYLDLSYEIDDKASISNAIANLAHTYKALNKFDEAAQKYDEGIKLVEEYGMKYLLPEYLIQKAELLFFEEKFEEAKALNQKGLKIAEEIGNAEYISKGKNLFERLNALHQKCEMKQN